MQIVHVDTILLNSCGVFCLFFPNDILPINTTTPLHAIQFNTDFGSPRNDVRYLLRSNEGSLNDTHKKIRIQKLQTFL